MGKNLDWKSKGSIDEAIESIAYSKVVRFYPTIIHKITGLPLETVFEYLLTRVEDKTLILKWEIKCPDYNCQHVIIRTESISDYMGKHIECDCEEEIEVKNSNTFPVFEINEEFRAYVRSKKKSLNLLKAL
ncbi:hypothetical protein [Priestia megaterium]|uniref:hypothetical protein n=1 Tax=Priestia megaterium TaxID=1404 RepID=UPI001FB2EA93|nr:hypothetical protein [Priestia megaterium]